MYPHFIEVHDGDQTMVVNIDKIGIVKDKLIMVEHPTRWQPVDESYDEIKKLITESGSLIQMGDPRLATTHPLKIKDLKKMIGEPFWTIITGFGQSGDAEYIFFYGDQYWKEDMHDVDDGLSWQAYRKERSDGLR